MDNVKDTRTFTKVEAAQQLGCSEMTVHRLVRDRKIGCFRIGTRVIIARKHIEDFLSRCEREPKIA